MVGLSTLGFGQNHARNWYFGKGAGLVFDGRYPMPLTDGKTASLEGVATISDPQGNLVCYSDGQTLWNAAHQVIASDLAGDPSATMSATLVPNRMNPNQYLLFTTAVMVNENGQAVPVPGGHYYVIDFSAANPEGKIINSYEISGTGPLQPNSVEKLLTVPYPASIIGDTLKNPGYWVVTHEYDKFVFRTTEFDQLPGTFTEYSTGVQHSNGTDDFGANRGASGYIAVSLQGNRIAVAIEGQKQVEVFQFNPLTGAVGRRQFILPAGDPDHKKEKRNNIYGLAFSPSGRFLYASCRDIGSVCQWDFNTMNTVEEVYFIRHNPDKPCGALQLAPNGKIYVAVNGEDYVGVINRPDRLAPRADYREFGARLVNNETGEGGTGTLGLPQFDMSSYVHKHFEYDHNCLGDTTIMFLTGSPVAGGYSTFGNTWTVVDPATGNPYTEIEIDEFLMGRWVFPHAGDFDVIVKGRYNAVNFTDTVRITILEPPKVKLAEDYTRMCRGDSLVLDAGNGAFYEWADETFRERRYVVTDADFEMIPLQEYRVKVIDYNGCIGWDTVHVEIKNPIKCEFNYTRAVCGDPTGSAEVIPANGVENCFYRWEDFPENTTNKIQNVAAGDYVVYVQSRFQGCESAHVAHVPEIGVTLATIEPSDSGIICPGESVTLFVSGEGATDYEWINPAGNTSQSVVVSPAVTTTYQVKVIAQEGSDYCEKIIGWTVRVQEVVSPVMETQYDLCEGDTLDLIAPEGFESYHWSTGAEGRFIQVLENMQGLVLTVLDQYDCESSITLQATFHEAPAVDLGEDITECTNQPILLSGGTGQEYLWNTGDDTRELAVLQTGIYTLRIGDFGCFNSDTISVNILNPDSLIIDSVRYEDISCFGAGDGKIEIFVHGTGSEYLYSLDGGTTYADNDGVFYDLRPGYVYELSVMEDGRCTKDYDVPIEITEPEALSFGFQTKLPNCPDCANGSIQVVEAAGGTLPYTYLWNTMDYGAALTNIQAGTYQVTLTDANNCTLTQSVLLEVGFRIPDAFTPNGDGVNDRWEIRVLRMYPACQVQVYDRLGVKVFEELNDYGNKVAWDGTFLGEPLPSGTYYYIIRLDPEKDPINGSVMIVR